MTNLWQVNIRVKTQDGKIGAVIYRTTATRKKTREAVEAWAIKKFSKMSVTGQVQVSVWDPKSPNLEERTP